MCRLNIECGIIYRSRTDWVISCIVLADITSVFCETIEVLCPKDSTALIKVVLIAAISARNLGTVVASPDEVARIGLTKSNEELDTVKIRLILAMSN